MKTREDFHREAEKLEALTDHLNLYIVDGCVALQNTICHTDIDHPEFWTRAISALRTNAAERLAENHGIDPSQFGLAY